MKMSSKLISRTEIGSIGILQEITNEGTTKSKLKSIEFNKNRSNLKDVKCNERISNSNSSKILSKRRNETCFDQLRSKDNPSSPNYFTLDGMLAFHQCIKSKEIYYDALRKFVVPVTNGLSRTVFVHGTTGTKSYECGPENPVMFAGSGIYVDVAWEIFTEMKNKRVAGCSVSASIVEVDTKGSVLRDLLSASPTLTACPNIVRCQDASDLLCLLVTGQKNCITLESNDDKQIIFRFIFSALSSSDAIESYLNLVFLTTPSRKEKVERSWQRNGKCNIEWNLIELGRRARSKAPVISNGSMGLIILCGSPSSEMPLYSNNSSVAVRKQKETFDAFVENSMRMAFKSLLIENGNLKSRLNDLQNLLEQQSMNQDDYRDRNERAHEKCVVKSFHHQIDAASTEREDYRASWNKEFKSVLGSALAALKATESECVESDKLRRESSEKICHGMKLFQEGQGNEIIEENCNELNLNENGSITHASSSCIQTMMFSDDLFGSDRNYSDEKEDLFEDTKLSGFDNCSSLTMDDLDWYDTLVAENCIAINEWDKLLHASNNEINESKEKIPEDFSVQPRRENKIFTFDDNHFTPQIDPIVTESDPSIDGVSNFLFCPAIACFSKTRKTSASF